MENKLFTFIAFALGLSLTACNSDKGIGLNSESPTTIYIAPNKVDCMTLSGPSECLLYKRPSLTDDVETLVWKQLPQGIQGFSYEAGYKYKLIVNIAPNPKPMPGTYAETWKLLQVSDKTPSSIVAKPGQP